MKKLALILTVVMMSIFAYSATITSTTGGGNWSTNSTWTGGVVPTSGDDVVINGPVVINGTFYCRHITINYGASLVNYSGTVTLYVSGNFSNNGSINRDINGWPLYLQIGGDIYNNGAWKNYHTYLSGSGNQTISQSSGKIFECYLTNYDTLGNIFLGSNVEFSPVNLNLNYDKFITGPYTLTLNSCYVANADIYSTGTIVSRRSVFTSVTFSGSYTFRGYMIIQNYVYCYGTATNADTLINDQATRTLYMKGNFINNGAVLNDNAWSLYFNTEGDITNNGTWKPWYTYLNAKGNQKISQAPGKWFEGEFNISDTAGLLYLGSDVYFRNNYFRMNYGKITTNGYDFNSEGETFYDGTFLGNDTLNLRKSYLAYNIILDGQMVLRGPATFGSNTVVKGTLTLIDTFSNDGATRSMYVYGNLINNGAMIRDKVGGWSFNINLYGNLHNNGYWNPRYTYLAAKTDQVLSQTPGKWFDGEFQISDTAGKVLLGSPVWFRDNIFRLNYGKIHTNGFTFNALRQTFYDGTFTGNDSLILKKSYLVNSMTLDGQIVLVGPATFGANTVFRGQTTLIDTFSNDPATRSLYVYGNLINHGAIIRDKVGGWSLLVYLYGNLHNNGYWNPRYTYLAAKTDQMISQTNGKWFDGEFQISDTAGKVFLGSDVWFRNDVLRLNYGKISTSGFDFNALSHTFYDGTFAGNDTLNLRKCYLAYNMTINGNMTLRGYTTLGANTAFIGNISLLDTFTNDPATRALYVYGNLVNNGAFIRDKFGGWSMQVYLYGNLHNNGYWNPRYTYLQSKSDQILSQSSGKWFDGEFQITDTAGKILLGSDVWFRNEIMRFNYGKIHTNGYNFNAHSAAMYDGSLVGNDTLNLRKCYLSRMNFNGNFVLKGSPLLGQDIVMAGHATLMDTLMNDGATRYWYITGDLTNNGTILTSPSGWWLTMYCAGNVWNNGVINNNAMYLNGKKTRTFGGKSPIGVICPVYVDDSVSFIGDNFIPNLTLTGKTTTWCTIKPNATLKTNAFANPNRMINFGKFESTFLLETHPSAFSFYHSTFRTNSTSKLSQLSIEHFGDQQHPQTKNAVSEWWRLNSVPMTGIDSLNYLTLSYFESARNGNTEKDMKVYYTENGGITWRVISRNVVWDTLNNTVRLNNCPTYGTFVLSSTGLDLVKFEPRLDKGEPRFFGNTGRVTLYGFGAGFTPDMTVKILHNSTSVDGESIKITDRAGESFSAEFQLAGVDTGYYDMIVQVPGQSPVTLTRYFHVELTTRPEPWATLSGRNRFLINRWSTFYINYGNRANVNALGVPLIFVINDLPNMEVEFPDNFFYLPKVAYDSGFTLPVDSNFNLYYVTDSLTGYIGKNMRVYAFYVPEIEANSSKLMRVMIKLPNAAKVYMDLWVMDPFMEPIPLMKAGTPPEVAACMAAAAMKYTFDKLVSFVPGYDCYKLIYKYIDPVGSITPKDMKPDKTGLASWFWNTASWVSSGLKCAADLNPAWKTAKIVIAAGSKITGFVIDVGKNYTISEGCWRKFRDKGRNKLESNGVYSFDPNEIAGPRGYGSDNYIGKTNLMSYRVYFENKDTAKAPATDVMVYDTLDKSRFDLSTFSFGQVVIADVVYPVQAFAKDFTLLLDLYPRIATVVKVRGSLDTSKGIISVIFNTLDRSTLEPNEEVDLGFLPPNKVKGEGEANVSYSVALKKTVKHNDFVRNQASIYFDANPPIATNIHSNRLDLVAPSSQVSALPSQTNDTLVQVKWSGSDDGCGLMHYNVFVSDNDSAYINWKINTSLTEATWRGKYNHTYKFYTVAIDSTGNTESTPKIPDTYTKLVRSGGMTDLVTSFVVYPNPSKGLVTIESNLYQGHMLLRVYDPTGRMVAATEEILNDRVVWNLSHLRSQVYYMTIEGPGFKLNKTLVLMNEGSR